MTAEPRSSRTKAVREVAAENHLLVVAWLVLLILLLVVGRELLNVDSWLTLVAGREIVEHGLPHRETLTVIPAGREWIDQQWLAQLLFYGLVRARGLGLALLVHALLVSSAIAVTMVASRIRGASVRMTLAATVACLVVAPWSWQLRAQSIALPLFALTLALTATDHDLAKRRTLLVFPLLVLWANVHGSVVLGEALVSLAALMVLLRRLRGSGPGTRFGWAVLYLILPWACTIASPYGTDLVHYYRELLVDSPVSRYVTEWQAPSPHGYQLAFFVVAAATVVVAVWQHRRLAIYDLAVLAITLASALRSVRAVVWFALALALLVPVALDGITGPAPIARVHRRAAGMLVGTCAAVVSFAALVTLVHDDAWYERGWPGAAARRPLVARGGDTVWASGTYADWLLWKEPSLHGRLASDSRFELLTESELRRIAVFNRMDPGWQAVVAPYPLLFLDRRRDAEQARRLTAQSRTRVLVTEGPTVVLERR